MKEDLVKKDWGTVPKVARPEQGLVLKEAFRPSRRWPGSWSPFRTGAIHETERRKTKRD